MRMRLVVRAHSYWQVSVGPNDIAKTFLKSHQKRCRHYRDCPPRQIATWLLSETHKRRFALILSWLRSWSSILFASSSTNICPFLVCPVRATFPAHSIRSDIRVQVKEDLTVPLIPAVLNPNISFSSLLSEPLNFRVQFSKPRKEKGKTVVLRSHCILCVCVQPAAAALNCIEGSGI